MKTDVYFNYAGETFSRAHLETELASLKNSLDGLVVWCGPHSRPVTYPEQVAAARLEALRAALERAAELADLFDLGAPVKVLDEELTRLASILWGALMAADALEEYGPLLRLAGGPRAIKDLPEVLHQLRDSLERVTPDSVSMAAEMMKCGCILKFPDNP
jgi:hypothetical protein